MKRESYTKYEMSDLKDMIDNGDDDEEVVVNDKTRKDHKPQKNWLTYFAAIWQSVNIAQLIYWHFSG